MALITIPNTFSAGAVIVASQHNSNFSTIAADYNGNIDNNNIASAAAIAYSKLNLATSIVNADVSASAAIANSKLNLASITGTINIGTAHQGDIFYDNGTTLTRLTPGTSGQFLQTQGVAANPIWAGGGVSQIFTSSGTFTAPTGITKVYLTMVGAGGGGEGNGNGGGGGGGAIINYAYTVVPGNNYTVTVGTGGTGGSSGGGPNNGTAGGNTSFDSSPVVLGGAGASGAGGAGGSSTASKNASTNTGGSVLAYFIGGNGANNGGGASVLGNGGDGLANGSPSTPSGFGGGGGGTGNGRGADGANGICIVMY